MSLDLASILHVDLSQAASDKADAVAAAREVAARDHDAVIAALRVEKELEVKRVQEAAAVATRKALSAARAAFDEERSMALSSASAESGGALAGALATLREDKDRQIDSLRAQLDEARLLSSRATQEAADSRYLLQEAKDEHALECINKDLAAARDKKAAVAEIRVWCKGEIQRAAEQAGVASGLGSGSAMLKYSEDDLASQLAVLTAEKDADKSAALVKAEEAVRRGALDAESSLVRTHPVLHITHPLLHPVVVLHMTFW